MKGTEETKPCITVVIVDDEENCIRSLEQYLCNDPRLKIVATINDSASAVEEIIAKKPDLLLLDIQMPDITGFDIIQELNRARVNPFVIFVTAFDKYAIQAIHVAAFDYLLKPVDRKELAVTIERVIEKICQRQSEKNYSILLNCFSKKKIKFNTTGGFIMVDPCDIIYIKADWNYSEVYTEKNKCEVVVINIGTVQNLLPKEDFVRINRSVIINTKYLEKVSRIKRQCILKKDNDIFTFTIPLRRIRELEKVL